MNRNRIPVTEQDSLTNMKRDGTNVTEKDYLVTSTTQIESSKKFTPLARTIAIFRGERSTQRSLNIKK